MTATLRLGRIAGVSVGINWSVLVIFVPICWGPSAGNLPANYPGYSGWAYAVAGVGAAVVFFLGLLAHEVSHALVAIRHGLGVKRITLWLFGGVAGISGEAPNPGAKVRIAGVGPVVSLLLGVFFGGTAAAVALAGHQGLTLGVLGWLTAINVALAMFNLLPAAPLDGGRLLRAALWKSRGDRAWAALMAARAGRALGIVLIVVGLWQFLIGATIGALWLALIGWFLFGAAGAEGRQAQLGAALAGVRVGELMSTEPTTVTPAMTVADFIDRFLLTHRHTAFPLVRDGEPVGLVTLGRVRQVAVELCGQTTLLEAACQPNELALAKPQEPLTDLLPRLNECADGRALVVVEHQLVGIVSPSDISRAVQRGALQARPSHRTAR